MIVYAEFRIEADNLRLQQPVELEAMRRELESALQGLPAMVGANVRVRIAEREYTSPPEFTAPEVGAAAPRGGGTDRGSTPAENGSGAAWLRHEKIVGGAAAGR